jgi:2-methylisocitrate lyase-like PEP mutase family enzyme
MTFTEALERLHHMCNAVNIPVLADGDTGYGGIINVRRSVREFEWAGAAAIQLEDQEMTKRCGHTKGKRLVKTEEMIFKIEAAIASRRSDDFLIIARTDARSVAGMDEAMKRAKLYEKAGADIIFFESPHSEEELKLIGGSFEKPVLANLVEGGKTPLVDIKSLEKMGFKIAIYPISCLLAAVRAMERAMGLLKAEGTTEGFLDHMTNFEQFNRLIGFPEIYEFEERFSGSSEPAPEASADGAC